jgi:2-polyprenyl-3-methyl-5-hydroxy-6-metoxy-1,4-benzoquinol methylase
MNLSSRRLRHDSTALERSYDEWHRVKYEKETPPTPTAPWHEMAKRHLPELTGRRILEIGCGPGSFARYLAGQGGVVLAGDFSAQACEIAKRICGDLVEVRQLDAQRLVEPLGESVFDVVVCLETLEHVPDHDRALREIVAVTRPGGRILVSTPNYLGLIGLYRVGLRLVRRRFDEMGQPINNVMIGCVRPWKLRRLGCRIDAVEGSVHALAVPGRGEIPIPFMERPAFKYLARHVLVAATKL